MERKEIIFGGVSNVPDDSMSQDGQLSLSVNAIKHNGSIQPVEKGTPLKYDNGDDIEIQKSERLEYVHHLPDTDEERYIVISSKEEIVLNRDSLTLTIGDSIYLQAAVIPQGANDSQLAWSSDNAGIASVDEDGKVTAKKVGTCTITYGFADGVGATKTCKVTVVQYVTEIGYRPQSTEANRLEVVVGSHIQIWPRVLPLSATSGLIWTSSDESIAHVTQNGYIIGMSAGNCTITIKADDYMGVEAYVYVTVKNAPVSITFDKPSITLLEGGEDFITATVKSSGEVPDVTWASDNESVAVIDRVIGNAAGTKSTARIRGVGLGTCTITATAGESYAVCDVEVKEKVLVTGITLSDSDISIYENQVYGIGVEEITPENATNQDVIWSSSDDSIAEVDEEGNVTAKSIGTCEITCRAADGGGAIATCTVEVKGIDYVDLGLDSGTLWSKTNIGASNPEDYGFYLSWGEAVEKGETKYTRDNYKFKNITSTPTKYNNKDGLLHLQDSDDAAKIRDGENWAIPNKAQVEELINNTVKTWEVRNGVYGITFQKKADPKKPFDPSKSIFIPAGGGITPQSGGSASAKIFEGERCLYWTRDWRLKDEVTSIDYVAYRMSAYCDEVGTVRAECSSTPDMTYNSTLRYAGLLIRPVWSPPSRNERPIKSGSEPIDITFKLTKRGSRVTMEGALDAGRTLIVELTYDGDTNRAKREYVPIRFTSSNSYVLSTRYSSAERTLTNARVVRYDDESVVLNVTWEIENKNPYYYGMIGSWDDIVEQGTRSILLSAPRAAPASGSTVITETYVGSNAALSSGGGSRYLFWFNKKSGSRKYIARINSAIREITSVKNVLIISTDAGLYFARNTGQEYQWLGQLPELPCVTPYLKPKWVDTSRLGMANVDLTYDISEWTLEGLYETKFKPSQGERAKLWKTISGIYGEMQKRCWEEGRFMHPFQVIFAYRMFDGTPLAISRPYVLCPTSTYTPAILFYDSNGQSQSTKEINMVSAYCQLAISITNNIPDKWNDIITHLDVYVSPEVSDYTADDSGDSIEWVYVASQDTGITEEKLKELCPSMLISHPTSSREDVNASYASVIIETDPTDVAHQAGTEHLAANALVRASYTQREGYAADMTDFCAIPKAECDSFEFKATNDRCDHYSWDNCPPTAREYEDYLKVRAALGANADDYTIITRKLTFKNGRNETEWKQTNYLKYFIVQSSCTMTNYTTGSQREIGQVNDPTAVIKLHRTTGKSAEEEFRTQGNFYRIASTEFKTLPDNEDYIPDIKKTDIELLTAKPPLDNKVINMYDFTCKDIFAYNSRINGVVDIQELEEPDFADNLDMGGDDGSERQEKTIYYAVEVVKQGITRVMPVPLTDYGVTYDNALRYFFYPNQNATRLLEYVADDNTINSYSLTKHEGIYGSYAFNDWKLLEPYETLTYDEEMSDADKAAFNELADKIQLGYNTKFHVGNKILQSDVENPFAFLNRGVVQLGCETIHRICATSRPISQGQAGQHPLYAFTDEGIYALAVNDEGEYMKADLVSPEVITSDDVHQVEQSVLFATSKGLMSISENDLVCLSANIEGHNHAEGLVSIENVKNLLGLEYVGSLGFHAKDWFTTSELVYDAKNGLIFLFQEPIPDDYGWHDVNLGLVYDVAEGVWGMYENKLLYGVNSYTDALAVQLSDRYGNGVLVNMSEPLNRHPLNMQGETYKSLLLTRPLKFGEKDEYKTMEDIILRGAQGTDNGMLVIWASNDLERWKVIGSSNNYKWRNYSGTPYKYFRIGVLMDGWQEGDSITGASVDITTRLTNKLR